MDNLSAFIAAESQFNATFSPVASNQRSVYRWEGSREKIPMYIRSGEFNCGLPAQRKFFNYIDFHGDGTANIRIYIDGAFWSQSTLTGQESWDIPRRLNLPAGTRGYGLSFELIGPYNLRGMDLSFMPLPGAGDS